VREVLIAAALSLCLSSAGVAQFSGSDFRARSQPERAFYSVGVFSGHFLIADPDRPEPTRKRLVRECLQGWESDQIEAVVSRYIDEHPEEWHFTAFILVYRAVHAACDVPIGDQAFADVDINLTKN
jgi:hypothetical protein